MQWKKDKYKACKADPKANDCVYADKLRDKRETKKNTDKYYTKTKDERDKADAAESASAKEDMAGLVAAATPEKPKVVGLAVGASCKKNEAGTRPACQEGHCCGNAKEGLFVGETMEVCDVKTNTQHKFKKGDNEVSY